MTCLDPGGINVPGMPWAMVLTVLMPSSRRCGQQSQQRNTHRMFTQDDALSDILARGVAVDPTTTILVTIQRGPVGLVTSLRGLVRPPTSGTGRRFACPTRDVSTRTCVFLNQRCTTLSFTRVCVFLLILPAVVRRYLDAR